MSLEPVEVLDGLPVEEPAPAAQLPAVQPVARQVVAIAATGLVAGATVAVMGRRWRRRGRLLPARRGRPKGVVGEIVGSNAFLVEVHLLRRD
jgi:hypothetical protein